MITVQDHDDENHVSMQKAWLYGAVVVPESLHVEVTTRQRGEKGRREEMRERRREVGRENFLDIGNSKSHLECHTSSTNITSPNTSQQFHQLGTKQSNICIYRKHS